MALVVLGTSVFLLPMMVAAGGGWSNPFALGSGNKAPSVAIDSSGNQHYVWANLSTGNIQYSKCTGMGGNGCSSPVNLPNGGSKAFFPSIAIDPQDRPNVVYDSKTSNGNAYEVFWTRKDDNGWSSPSKISNHDHSEIPDIAIGPSGIIHVIYRSQPSGGTNGVIYYAESSDGFNFSEAELLAEIVSDKPMESPSEMMEAGKNEPEANKIADGLYPHIAADQNDKAHVVWNNPSPSYAVMYKYQQGNGWSNQIKVHSGNKDQTPDVTVAPNNSVGILWSRYDTFNVSFAEYIDGQRDNYIPDIDGGLGYSLYPRISSDCANKFHFVFQGSVGTDSKWNIYYRSYDPSNNSLGGRATIANIDAQEQTPAVDTTNIAAVVYWNSTNEIADAATKDLGITCTGGATPTPSNTPTATNTPDPNVTPTVTPTVGGPIWVPNTSSEIIYRKKWKKINDNKATDNNYSRCDDGGACVKRSAAKIMVPDGYTQVKWFTGKSKVNGIANVFINDQFVGKVDLCKGSSGNTQQFFNKTYTIPARTDGQPRSFEVGAPGKHSSCSPYNANFVVIDGFEILP